jgi:hypothetical protein
MTDPLLGICHLLPTTLIPTLWVGHVNPHVWQKVTIIYSIHEWINLVWICVLLLFSLCGFPPLQWSQFYTHCISQYIVAGIGEWLNLHVMYPVWWSTSIPRVAAILWLSCCLDLEFLWAESHLIHNYLFLRVTVWSHFCQSVIFTTLCFIHV